jgi:hypothetical protein
MVSRSREVKDNPNIGGFTMGKALDNVERLAAVFDEKKIAIIDNVVIFNHHLVHPVMLDMFEFMLKVERNHNLAAIFICADGPAGKLGEYERWSRSFLLSLPRILSYTLETEEKADGLSLTAGCWINLAHTFLHELRHNVSRALEVAVKGETDTPEYEESLEQDAHEYAGFTLEKMVAEKRLEMPPLNEIPYFNTAIMETLVEEIRNGERAWAGHHKRLIDNNLIYSKDAHIYTSIYDYFLDTTQQPEVYGKPLEVGPNDVRKYPLELVDKIGPSNIFDQEVMPGEQIRELFKSNFPELAVRAEEEKTKLEENPDGSITFVGDTNSPFAEEMRKRGATEEDVQRGVRNAISAGYIEKPVEKGERMDLDELEMLDSVDRTDEGDPIVDDVDEVACGIETATATQTTPVYNSREEMMRAVAANPTAHQPGHEGGIWYGPQEAARDLCMDVYARLVDHMFAVCGHQGDGLFTNAGSVVAIGMSLSGREIESGLFVSSYTVNLTSMNAVWDDCRKAGGIRGRTFKEGSLPGYDLMINWFGKVRRVRIVAQNPNKSSGVAARARAGAKIAWLIDQDAPNGQGFVGSFENGVYTPCKR